MTRALCLMACFAMVGMSLGGLFAPNGQRDQMVSIALFAVGNAGAMLIGQKANSR